MSPISTLWSVPASATGAVLPTTPVMVTVSASLSSVPSLTTNVTTYSPATSGVNVGITESASVSAAELPSGVVVSDHE